MIHPSIVRLVSLHRPEMGPDDLWVLLSKAQVVHSLEWLSGWLWDYRVADVLSRLTGHCLSCGDDLNDPVARRSFCSDACRAKAFRDRRVSGGARLEQEVAAAGRRLEALREELDSFRRWYRRVSGMQIMPPDLLRVQHLPKLPGRCGRGCSRGVGCAHTGGAACLFAGTRGCLDGE